MGHGQLGRALFAQPTRIRRQLASTRTWTITGRGDALSAARDVFYSQDFLSTSNEILRNLHRYLCVPAADVIVATVNKQPCAELTAAAEPADDMEQRGELLRIGLRSCSLIMRRTWLPSGNMP